MVKRAKNEINKTLSLRIVNPNTASIDIVATETQVCVPTNRDSENNRRFGCFTRYCPKFCVNGNRIQL